MKQDERHVRTRSCVTKMHSFRSYAWIKIFRTVGFAILCYSALSGLRKIHERLGLINHEYEALVAYQIKPPAAGTFEPPTQYSIKWG